MVFYPVLGGMSLYVFPSPCRSRSSHKPTNFDFDWLTVHDKKTIVEAIGYIGRVISAGETPDWTLTPYLIQSLLILLGPSLYAASIYMILGRLTCMLEAEAYSVIRVKWLTKIFVLGDVFSFLAQGAGKS